LPSQAFPTEKRPEKAKICLAFLDFQKSQGLQKKPEFQNLVSKEPSWQP